LPRCALAAEQNPVKHARKIFNGFDVERNGFLDIHHLKATCSAMAKHEAREVKITAHPSAFVVCLFLSAQAFKEFVARNTSFSVTSAILRFQKQWHDTARYNALSDIRNRYRSRAACCLHHAPAPPRSLGLDQLPMPTHHEACWRAASLLAPALAGCTLAATGLRPGSWLPGCRRIALTALRVCVSANRAPWTRRPPTADAGSRKPSSGR
jgi:hypothetical protein